MNQLIAKIKKLPIMQHKWVQFLIYLVKNFIDDNCTQKASSLTYTTLLSIVPIFTLVVVILSSIPQLAEAKEQIQNVIFSNLLPSTSFQVAKYINQLIYYSSVQRVIYLFMMVSYIVLCKIPSNVMAALCSFVKLITYPPKTIKRSRLTILIHSILTV